MLRQTTQHSCGASCLLILEYIFGHLEEGKLSSERELSINKRLDGKPILGIDSNKMLEYVELHGTLSRRLKDSGSGTYKDGLCIANIKNWRSGIGYYVIMLKKEVDEYTILDPIDGEIHKISKDNFLWESGDGSLKEWSINFNASKEEIHKIIDKENKPVIHIIKGSEDNFNPVYDTVSFLEELYLGNGYLVSVETDDMIHVIDNQLYIGSKMVRDIDTIWIKIDPKQEERYFNILRVLSLFEDEVDFINKPSLILKYDDKTLPFKILKRSGRIVCNKNNLLKAFHDNKSAVIKRMNGFGGRDVHFIKEKEDIGSLDYPIVKENDISVPDNNNVDTRIFWFKGKFVGAVNRYSNGSSYCNMTQDGTHKSFKLNDISFSEEISKDLNMVSRFLSENGFSIAGVDVLNGKAITEINISNPSAFKNYIEDTGDNFIKSAVKPHPSGYKAQ